MQLRPFFSDLKDPLYETGIGLYHQRYSTNTLPAWKLAHPFRMMAHNGEINTIYGNRHWAKARQPELTSSLWESMSQFLPVIKPGGSDSANFDNMLEMISKSGRELAHSLSMMVPIAFKGSPFVAKEVQSFYKFHQMISDPWDGPAALVVSDGKSIVSSLDRNGLRPSRYKITNTGLIFLGSEVGIGNLSEDQVIKKGRLGPGEIILVDTENGKILFNNEVKEMLAKKQPYEKWISNNAYYLVEKSIPKEASTKLPETDLFKLSASFGYNQEDINITLKPYFQTGLELTGSCGDTAPLAILSRRPRQLFQYFRQLFAQVTNPPIDSIRENAVMDTIVYLGAKPSNLEESPEQAKQVVLNSPALTELEFEEIKSLPDPAFASATISTLFPAADGVSSFLEAVERVCQAAEEAVDQGKKILILSDRGKNDKTASLPTLIAVGAVHQYLIREGKRMLCSIIVDSGEIYSVHQFGCLVAYGASAVNPYLVWDWINYFENKIGDLTTEQMVTNYKTAIHKGLLKLMSKMGISQLNGYFSSQLFEIIGLHESVVARFFTGSHSGVSGMNLKEIAEETLRIHKEGFAIKGNLPNVGFYSYRPNGYRQGITPKVVQALHKFVNVRDADKDRPIPWRDLVRTKAPASYQNFLNELEKTRPIVLRDLLHFKSTESIPIDQVESIEKIRSRLLTAAMSLGALSPEAHETLGIAMNRIGCKSDSGEGGEDPLRYKPMSNGDYKNSLIKQVASGRFGVTPEYLVNASELEIKMAQGAKPGEGGQLPAQKVSKEIAKLRHSPEGVILISPPPHHDIYSIEDLAQLIYNLKHVNPTAKVCVKLVSEQGVGTIAAGVTKAQADIILISGYDGGTGASPWSSIKSVGSPWELGLAEAQQVLMMNNLRDRIILRVDGGIRNGRDVVVAAILGAEEFGLGTASLISMGCIFCRQCNIGSCPTGICTQDPKLRKNFRGTPEGVITYFNAIANEVREILSKLGVRSVQEIIGQTEYLEQISYPDHPKANTVDLSPLLYIPEGSTSAPYHTWERNNRLEDNSLDEIILKDIETTPESIEKISLEYDISNTQRSIGTRLSGEIAYRYGNAGLPPDSIDLKLRGSAGQGLGIFLVNGIKLDVIGEANDFVGEGMNGGLIIIRPPEGSSYDPSDSAICGNTCLYGATGGEMYVYGQAGERYGVRNSGATSVVEGFGDHGCEYMTGGVIVVLGPVGNNFGAGMSGGIAYVLDEGKKVEKLVNYTMVKIERLTNNNDKQLLDLIRKHHEYTGSKKAKKILDNFETYRPLFWKVIPKGK